MKLTETVRKEYLLIISAVAAVASLPFVDFATVCSYDYERILRTVATLLVFLLIVGCLKECKALDTVAGRVIGRGHGSASLCMTLVLLPFFTSMLFSNDVSLITFVPMAIAVLRASDLTERIPAVVVLQTAAANIGSSLTPFGNPHNLYIYNLREDYGFSFWDYESALIPIVIIGLVAVIAITLLLPRKQVEPFHRKDEGIEHRNVLPVLLALFIMAILSVLGTIPLELTLIVTIVACAIMMPRVFLKADYGLLLMFILLFVFANNLANIPSVHGTIVGWMDHNPLLTTVAVSQLTSNVSSTILLQPFTSDWAAILVGADIGGFGTPVAAMANLISLKIYLREEDSSVKTYLKTFFAIELTLLAVLLLAYYALY